MRPEPPPPSPLSPLTHADPSAASYLRAALEAYIRGEYQTAVDLVTEAMALAGDRPDFGPWMAWAANCSLLLETGAIADFDVTPPAEVGAR